MDGIDVLINSLYGPMDKRSQAARDTSSGDRQEDRRMPR